MATPRTWNTSTHMDRPPLPATMNRREAAKRKGPLRRIYSSHNVVVEEAKSPRVGILTGRLPVRLNASGPSTSARVLEACLQRRPAPATSPSPLPSRSPSPPAPRTTRTATAATGCCLLRCSSLGVACLARAGRSDATASHHPDESTVSPQRFVPALKHTYRFGVRVNLFTPPLSTSLYSLSVHPPPPHELPVRRPYGIDCTVYCIRTAMNPPLIHPLTLSRRHTFTHARPLTYTFPGVRLWGTTAP
jgi:hypothetical protein